MRHLQHLTFLLVLSIGLLAHELPAEEMPLRGRNNLTEKLKISQVGLFQQRGITLQVGNAGGFDEGTVRVKLQAFTPMEAMDYMVLYSTAEEICQQFETGIPVVVFFHDAPTTDKRDGAASASFGRDINGKVQELYDYSRPRKRSDEALPQDIPDYEILDEVTLLDKRRYASILIPSLTPTTKPEVIERVLRAILKKEGFDTGAAYATREARKADGSASYSKANPDAYKSGFLGALLDGKFHAAQPR